MGTFASLGLDQGTTALMARRRAAGDVGGAHAVFRLALGAGLALSALVAGVAWLALGWLGQLGGQTPELVAGQRLMLLALPAIALYRIATGAAVAFVNALAPALVLRALVPGTSGAAWAAAVFTALFVAALCRWASEDPRCECVAVPSAISAVGTPSLWSAAVGEISGTFRSSRAGKSAGL
jgi:hypothetical protein